MARNSGCTSNERCQRVLDLYAVDKSCIRQLDLPYLLLGDALAQKHRCAVHLRVASVRSLIGTAVRRSRFRSPTVRRGPAT